jgi:hypothetical protein
MIFAYDTSVKISNTGFRDYLYTVKPISLSYVMFAANKFVLNLQKTYTIYNKSLITLCITYRL